MAVGAMNKAQRAQHEENLWRNNTYNPEKFKQKIFGLERDGKVDRSILWAPWFMEVKAAANAKRFGRRGSKRKQKRKSKKQKRAAEETSGQGPSADVLPSSKQKAAKERGSN